MQKVFVLNSEKDPLMPCHPARARQLLRTKRAKVFRRYPFVIILIAKTTNAIQPIEIKFDPGSRTTGVCVGETGENVLIQKTTLPILIKAMGRGSRQMCRVDQFGFPRTGAKSAKTVKGFQTGDLVKAIVTKGKKIGIYTGRVAVRTSGSFNIKTGSETVQGISWKYCNLIQKTDGYTYG
jgi:hypothetical protein